jgi:hypothetical protein
LLENCILKRTAEFKKLSITAEGNLLLVIPSTLHDWVLAHSPRNRFSYLLNHPTSECDARAAGQKDPLLV